MHRRFRVTTEVQNRRVWMGLLAFLSFVSPHHWGWLATLPPAKVDALSPCRDPPPADETPVSPPGTLPLSLRPLTFSPFQTVICPVRVCRVSLPLFPSVAAYVCACAGLQATARFRAGPVVTDRAGLVRLFGRNPAGTSVDQNKERKGKSKRGANACLEPSKTPTHPVCLLASRRGRRNPCPFPFPDFTRCKWYHSRVKKKPRWLCVVLQHADTSLLSVTMVSLLSLLDSCFVRSCPPLHRIADVLPLEEGATTADGLFANVASCFGLRCVRVWAISEVLQHRRGHRRERGVIGWGGWDVPRTHSTTEKQAQPVLRLLVLSHALAAPCPALRRAGVDVHLGRVVSRVRTALGSGDRHRQAVESLRQNGLSLRSRLLA